MSNRETEFAWNYHNRTKHPPKACGATPIFSIGTPTPSPSRFIPAWIRSRCPGHHRDRIAALSAISAAPASSPRTLNLEALTHLLYFSAGITKRSQFPGREILFRAAACTGALYEIELYLVCGPLVDLAAGVYHFGPGDLALRRLRVRDFRGVLGTGAPAALVATGVYWRNA